jgi:phosphohistidine phosphatase
MTATRSEESRGVSICLVRHAIAAERGPDWPDDAQRPLTKSGAKRFARCAAGLARLGGIPDEIFSSPLVRARETAALLEAAATARTTGTAKRPSVTIVSVLAPGSNPALVLARLAKRAKRTRVAVVGHEPDLGALAAFLLGAARPLPMKKGGVCRIDLPSWRAQGEGTLVWWLPPRVLRTLR